MKPVKLEFKGLNSFSERAVIDFEPLLKSGIFGIFGETGSGKSTILDAINFALYGDIERNPDKLDKINYKCGELDVKFIFDIFSDGARRTYLVERNIKKKSGTHRALLYEYSADGSSQAIADNVKSVNDKITDIIGINKEDFRKCIALTQGEFAQFVNSAPSERIELIERLFNLQKYGKALKAKLSARENAAQTEYAATEGALTAYEDATKEKLQELEGAAAALQSALDGLKQAADEAEKCYSRENKLLEQKKAYAAAAARLEKLRARKPEFDELGRVLPALAVCERVCAEADKAEACAVRIDALKADGEKLARQSLSVKGQSDEVERELREGGLDSIAEKLQRESALMEGMLPTADTLAARRAELERCRRQYRDESANGAEYAKLRDNKSAELKKAAAELSRCPDLNIDEYFKKELKGGILKDEYARALDYIKQLRAEMRTYNDNSPLYDFVGGELDKKAEEYKELILSVKDARIDVNGELRRFRDALEMKKKLELAVKKFEGELNTAELRAKSSGERIAELKERGVRLAGECGELSGKLKQVFGEEDAEKCKAMAADTKAKLQNLRLRKAELTEKAEKLKLQLNEYDKMLAANGAEIRSLAEQRATSERAAEEGVASAKMESLAACRALIKKYDGYEKALEDFNAFTTEYAKAEGEAKNAEPEEGADSVTEDSVADALSAKIEARAAYSRNISELAVAQKSAADLKERLKTKAELKKKFDCIKRECDLLGRLKSLLRDNKFMEYIANEHLVNISGAASRTLIELTDGRYYLAYVDNNFCVGDNYNGGEMRKVKTLSGGETFLVSLSLALALSSTICNRSLKSIEFFFLDEGFGTLDGDLIDTVLSALEKLKNENFSIGLISHVEELKHRISSKILVNKATESHGSTIRISC